jgi:hypothetical protein
MVPKMKKLTLAVVTQFLKDRIEYVFNINQVMKYVQRNLLLQGM